MIWETRQHETRRDEMKYREELEGKRKRGKGEERKSCLFLRLSCVASASYHLPLFL